MPPVDLKALAVAPPAPVAKIDATDLVASPFRAPRDYQTAAPPDTCQSRWAPIEGSEELERVLALERRAPLVAGSPRGEALIEMMTARWSRGPRACACAEIDPQIKAGKRQCLKRLNFIQAWALYEIGIVGGLVGFMAVGTGKGLLNFLTMLAFSEFDPKIKSGLLLVPPNLVEQLAHEYELLREHFVVPEIWYHTSDKIPPGLSPGMPVLHVRPYSLLSGDKYSDWVRNLSPDVVIADEADKLKNIAGAGTSRIFRQFYERGDTRFAGWSGSFTNAGIGEYAPLAALALRYQSPLPLDWAVTERWGQAIDSSNSPAPPGALLRLCAPGETVQQGFGRRLAETMGIIISVGASVDVGFTLTEREPPALPPAVTEELAKLRAGWVRPDGEELVDAMQVAKCATELACGMYYYWWFPRGEPESLIKEWLAARKDYFQELRQTLLPRDEFMDSPKLCQVAAMRHHGDLPQREDRPVWQSYAWPRWRDVKALVKPETKAAWIDEWLARDAAEWALEERGVVWYGIVEFGRKIAELAGLPLHDGGPDAGVRLIGGRSKKTGKSYAGEDGSRAAICSIDSHHRGRDGMQRIWRKQLLANLTANAAKLEQLFGRLHRQGQEEDVEAEYYAHTPEVEDRLETALRNAGYIQNTIPGNTQKLRIGLRLE